MGSETGVRSWCRGEPPPPAAGEAAAVEAVWAKEGQGLRVVVLGTAIETMWVHWSDGHSVPCFGARQGCPFCQVDDREWQGYLPAWCVQRGRDVLVVLRRTLGAAVIEAAEGAGHLRGLELALSTGGRGKGRWAKAEVLKDHAGAAALRREFVIGPTLDRIFGVGEWRVAGKEGGGQ